MFSQNIEEIFSFENFMFFYNSISNSERKIKNRLNLFNLYSEILNELKDKKYKPQGFTCFYKSHPKEREILTPKFKDQIVQHFLVFLINELFENDLSNNSFANRKNMGTRKAVKKVQEYCLKYPKGYYLKCDIKNYFPSINKDILKELLFLKIEKSNFSKEKKELIFFLINQTLPYDFKKITHIIKNKDISNLIPPHKSLFNAKYNKGLPIGSFISQFYSLIYLNVLDEFIEKHLNIKHYARFVDDFVIIEETKNNFDKYLIEINNFLKTTLDCELNQTKTKINFTKNGIDFVGYIIKPYNLL